MLDANNVVAQFTIRDRRKNYPLYCWILEILYCNPKGRRALLRIPTTEGCCLQEYLAHNKTPTPLGPS